MQLLEVYLNIAGENVESHLPDNGAPLCELPKVVVTTFTTPTGCCKKVLLNVYIFLIPELSLPFKC